MTLDPVSDAGNTTDNAQQDNWEQRYQGLQKVLAKRDTELTAATAQLDQLRAEREQAAAELETYRQRETDASEEEQARQQYEQLRARFEPEPPTPIGNNPPRDWMDKQDQSDNHYASKGSKAGLAWPL